MPKLQHLVVDTTAFVKNVQLQNIAENCYTVPGVLGEIRNNRQIKALAVLPYELKVRKPDNDVLAKVMAMAKKTGDFASLSLVDLQVIALTYELELEHVGMDHLRDKPRPALLMSSAKKPVTLKTTVLMKGLYVPKSCNGQNPTGHGPERADESTKGNPCKKEFSTDDSHAVSPEPPKKASESEKSGISDKVDEESDDEGDWITPTNIVQMKLNIGKDLLEKVTAPVACITTDYALQNVLKQIGLQIASLDGRIIKQTRTYILRCYACFMITPNATKKFCPKCGYQTLKKVSVNLNENGQQIIHINNQRPLTAKHKNQPVAKFNGGKYATNPLLFEDQPVPQQRIPLKTRAKTNALGEDYIAGYSPFVMRDIDSRSTVLRGSVNIKQRMINLEYDNKRRGYFK
ncbi:RNA-binding protein NOB1-like [Anopheles nili]|uniref:RNA-binding protein NOB1-like n=1 Tax=Anopheles nili TaxID=185578 RepID=UPI00237AB0BA|nr:RNA-binding protein NOB1-like [Anopheles nili]